MLPSHPSYKRTLACQGTGRVCLMLVYETSSYLNIIILILHKDNVQLSCKYIYNSIHRRLNTIGKYRIYNKVRTI